MAQINVNPITRLIFGSSDANHFIPFTFPGMDVIDTARFVPGNPKSVLQFANVGDQRARVAVFAVSRDAFTRAIICVLPETGRPDRVLLGVSFRVSTNGVSQYYESLGWEDPLSEDLVKDFLGLLGGTRTGKVLPRWGTQMLSSKKKMALLLFVRAKPDGGNVEGELGPLVTDGVFVKKAIELISVQTGNSFATDLLEVFTYSNAILDCNKLLAALAGSRISTVYGIDTIQPWTLLAGPATESKLFFSGETGTTQPEFMPLSRWAAEPLGIRTFAGRTPIKKAKFDYLHNFVMPKYTLRLGIERSK